MAQTTKMKSDRVTEVVVAETTEKGSAGALTFTNYVQGSTFHGLSYVFQPSYSVYRR